MALLDSNIVEQLKGYFNNINGNIEMVAFLDESDKSKELDSFGEDVELEKSYNITRPISFTLLKDGEKSGINFNGIPGGHEFNSFILAILGLAGMGKKLEDDQLARVQAINKPLNIETYVSLSCTKCPEVIQALNVISMGNSNITTSLIDGGVYTQEVSEKNIQGVPVVYINGEKVSVGEKTIEELITIITNA